MPPRGITPFTSKKSAAALAGSLEAVVGLLRMKDNETAEVAARKLKQTHALFGPATESAERDQAAKAKCILASKAAAEALAGFNATATGYGGVMRCTGLKFITTQGDASEIATSQIIPALERMDLQLARNLAALGSSLVEEFHEAKLTEAKVSQRAAASASQWSRLYAEITVRIREARAIQTANGLDVPKKRRKPGAGRPRAVRPASAEDERGPADLDSGQGEPGRPQAVSVASTGLGPPLTPGASYEAYFVVSRHPDRPQRAPQLGGTAPGDPAGAITRGADVP